MKRSEAEIAAAIVAWLRSQGWEVYQEVQPPRNVSGRCDIVATQGPIVWAIETKTSLSLSLIGQAVEWKPFAHYVSVGIPFSRYNRFAERVLRDYGIGLLNVYRDDVNETRTPALQRKISPILKNALCEEQKTYAEAGNNRSEFYSPFKKTRDLLIDLVKRKPGIRLRVAVGELSHHYSSHVNAVASLRVWINSGLIKGLRLEKGMLYPKEEAEKVTSVLASETGKENLPKVEHE